MITLMLKISEKQDLSNKMVVRKWPASCKRIKLHLLLNTNGSTSQMFSKNESITLLLHPNSNTIVEFSSSHGLLLTFEETINKLDGEATGFIFLGIFMYLCALVGLYYVVFHLVRRKKRRSS